MSALRISGTSFLLPSHKAWRSLDMTGDADFGEYGDWAAALMETPNNTPLVVCIFIEDLIGHYPSDVETAEAALSSILGLLETRLSAASAPTVVLFGSAGGESFVWSLKRQTTADRMLGYLSDNLYRFAQQHNSLSVVSINDIFARNGTTRCFDRRNWFASRCHLSNEGLTALADSIVRTLVFLKTVPAKLLVLDCDNTLWGGVVGEDGVSDLRVGQDGTGSAFSMFQEAVRNLSRQGLLLAIASKNNEEDVWSVFDNHSGMVLKREDIVTSKINWTPKPENIAAMASELNIGLDSIVFWDDNPLERDQMRHALPEVITVDVPVDPWHWCDTLGNLDCLTRAQVTDDDRRKIDQYRSRAAFVKDAGSVSDQLGYLRSIKLKPEALPIDSSTISRASQLSVKTNQFNMRLRRHDEASLTAFVASNESLSFLTRLEDIYGDHGITGMVCTTPISAKRLYVDNFIMSCRILGRHLEAWMLSEICRRARSAGYEELVFEYAHGKRNQMIRDFLDTYPFVEDETLCADPDISNHMQDPSSQLYRVTTQMPDIPNIEIYEHE